MSSRSTGDGIGIPCIDPGGGGSPASLSVPQLEVELIRSG